MATCPFPCFITLSLGSPVKATLLSTRGAGTTHHSPAQLQQDYVQTCLTPAMLQGLFREPGCEAEPQAA